MNKDIIKKAIILAIIITVFSLLITKWLDYKKQKDYEMISQDMIQTTNETSKDLSLVKLKIKEDSITKTGLTLVITDYNEPSFGWGPGYEVLKLINNEEWIPVTPNVPMVFNEIAYMLDENHQWEYVIDWTNFYGELETGKYKIKKTIYNNGYIDLYSNEFEIK
jgi:hypothetical protein